MTVSTDVVGHAGGTYTGDIQGCYDYWQNSYPAPVGYVYSFSTYTPQDKGLKALSIIKILIKKKVAKIDTIEQFIDVMDELVKVL